MNVNAEITTQGSCNSSTNPVFIIQAPSGAGQVRKTFTGTIATSTTVTVAATLYTVTAGKTFYLTDVSFCNNSANSSLVSVNASASLNTAYIMEGHSQSTSPYVMTNIGTEPSVAGGTPITAQAALTTVATTVSYFIAGYEQ